MQTARRILEQLGRVTPLDPEQELVTVCAALLHDLGTARSATCSSG
jgi:HD superfamily phosphohydrolase